MRERALVEAALTLTSALDVEAVCNAVLDVVERVFEAQSAWVLLHDPKSDRLMTMAVRGHGSEAYLGAAVASGEGIVGLAFSSGEPVFVPDVQHEDRWFDPQRLHQSGLPSVVTTPLMHDEDRLGVLGFSSPRFTPEALPSPGDRALFQGLGALASLALRNARLFDEVQDERVRRTRLHRRQKQLREQVGRLREQIREHGGHGRIIGTCEAIANVLEQAQLVAPADTTVLLLGETGTGKELFARVIHDGSRRARQAFLPVNCAAMPTTLLESELFGHEKGAFTGATERKLGRFELAHGGTLFLDEIGDLPHEAQAKLLRVLQDGEVQRIGAVKPLRINVRVIAATNQDLSAGVENGAFRADLYYRLSVFPIRLPPLRDRREDVLPLVTHFVEHFATQLHTAAPAIEPAAIRLLEEYDWPGNVRELQNVIERAVILAAGGAIRPEMLALSRPRVRATPRETTPIAPSESVESRVSPTEDAPATVPLAVAEETAIRRALEATGWRISGRDGAAERLCLKPTTLHAKMKKLGIRRPGR
jgi:formate hydrogenlyase transcriptional activator